MRICFDNELGSIEMSGGGEDNIRITAINGLGIPQYERRTYSSYDFDGVVEGMRRVPMRSITIGGDIKGGRELVQKMIKILSSPAVMTIKTNEIERIINVSQVSCELKKRSKTYTSFALSLSCDDPYFYDAQETVRGLYVREKLIDNKMTLPAVFSTRTTSASVKIESDREVEPTIIILGKKKITNETDGKIEIINTVTGALFTLLYVPLDDEVITVDVAKRTVTSDINGNIIRYISDDSYMSDLVIDRRGAEFSTTSYGAAGDITAYLVYRNKYLEAII